MTPRSIYNCLLICSLALLAACKQPEPNTNDVPTQPTQAKPALMAPFRYHKLIESSPANYFDVFSWGRGKDSSGVYMILRSDSLGKQYSTTSGDLEGAIIDVYNTDMNMDGNPEILIEAKVKDTINHINIYAYEFNGTKAHKIDFPKLSTASKKGYRGEDYFYIKQGNLIREFPIYNGNGKNAKPTGKKKILQYGIGDNSFTVKDISPVDATTKPAVIEPVKKPVVAEKAKAASTKKKTKVVKHEVKKKKKKHHRSE